MGIGEAGMLVYLSRDETGKEPTTRDASGCSLQVRSRAPFDLSRI
jgi:hypothetical protein